MKLDIPYADGSMPLEIADGRVVAITGLNHVDVGDEAATVRHALNNPIGGASFTEFIQGIDDVLFIVNDGTRPTPTAKVLETLWDEIASIPTPRFIVATGTHRAANDAELLRIFGEKFLGRYRGAIISHDAKCHEMVDLGVTSRATPVRINHLVYEASRIVAISSVEPHYFSGYTGGRKSLFPGVAAYETIEKSHANIMKPGVAPLALRGNPVHEDQVEALSLLGDKPIFSIQTVLSHDDRIFAVSAGDIHKSFDTAVAKARDVFTVAIPEKADVVLSVAPFPMGSSLLQLQKAMNNGIAGMKEGGTIILVGACPDGVGKGNFHQLMRDVGDPSRVMEAARMSYKLGYHIAYNMSKLALGGGIFLVSGLPDQTVREMFIEPKSSVQDAVNSGLQVHGPDAKILVLTHGSLTVPVVKTQ